MITFYSYICNRYNYKGYEKMEYNQQFIDKIRVLMPINFRSELHEALNKGKHKKNRIPYSTVCDSLRVYRLGIRTRNGKTHSFSKTHAGNGSKVDKIKIYDKAVELLAEKGIIAQ